MTHGTRVCYQRLRCRCEPCTDANTAYMARYRDAQRHGRPVLGTHVPAAEASTLLRALLEEGFLKAEIARHLGHRWPVLHWHQPAGVTLRTTLRLRVISRRLCS